MISSQLKNYVSSNMKNMEVVPVSSRKIENFAADSRSNSSPSIEDLRKKYFSEDYTPAAKQEQSVPLASDDNDGIEIGLLRKKSFSDDNSLDDNDQRTIISSRDEGVIGSQG